MSTTSSGTGIIVLTKECENITVPASKRAKFRLLGKRTEFTGVN